MNRLTKLYKAGRYGLVKVKDNEQEVDSPYPNTLRAILESFQRLGEYENTNLTPAEIVAMLEELEALKASKPVAEIPATANRVLSLAEVLALPEGERVWVEDKRYQSLCGQYRVKRDHTDDKSNRFLSLCLINDAGKYWPLSDDFNRAWFAKEDRVWSLPVEPTEDEMRRNPWGKKGE